MIRLLSAVCLSATLAAAWVAADEDWSRFRGERGAGVTAVKGIRVQWSGPEDFAWQTELPGAGASTPVLWGKKAFLTAYSGYGLDPRNPGAMDELKYHVLCVDTDTGKIDWNTALDAETPETPYARYMRLHGYASSSAVVDADAVYTFFGRTGVIALDHSGKKLWQTDVGDRLHARGWGSGASPILFGDKVIVNAGVESDALIALEKKTGKKLWQQGGMEETWATPIVADGGDRAELVISVQDKLLAYDPRTGDPLWTARGIGGYICPSPVAHDGVVYAIGGLRVTAVAVRTGGSGDVSASHTLWRVGAGSNVVSPVYCGAHLYFMHERAGTAYCVNAETGAIAYEQRLKPHPREVYASPLAAEGRIYYVSRQNGTYVLAARAQFELLAHNTIEGDESVFNASPVPLPDGRLLLRSDAKLHCVKSR
jgi:outer membrane protein assembly factor BamB